MPNIDFDFHGHISNVEVAFAYDAVTKQNIDVRSWTSQQLADALNAGSVMISLGDYLYYSDNNTIVKENYTPSS